MTDKRAGERARTFIKGRLMFGAGVMSADCDVRNLSPTGAKIMVDEEIPIPNEFTLDLPSKSRSFKATVAWRHGDEVGLAFEPEAAPADPADPQARITQLEAENAKLRSQIRRLQGELALRGTMDMSGI